jgi:hypothetical protein
MKIAVCLSGQARTWESAKENILQYFGVCDEVDYFIHTWDVNSYRNSGEKIRERKDYRIDNEELNNLQNYFQPKKMMVDSYNSDIFGKNWNSLFYSFMKSIWLKRKFELENDFKYDIVIKSRFDINFLQSGLNHLGLPINKFHIHPVKPLTAYCSNSNFDRFPFEFNSNVFDDVIFYSDSSTMDLISNVYRWNKEIVNRGTDKKNKGDFIEDVEFYLGPGALLYRHMINWGIFPRNEVIIPYYVVRKEALDLGLHSIKDWNQIKEISTNWYNSVKYVDNKIK